MKFLLEKSTKEPEEYAKFYADYQIFLKSGIVFADLPETRVIAYFMFSTSKRSHHYGGIFDV